MRPYAPTLLALALAGPVARAETVSCRADVMIRQIYQATVDTETGALTVTNNAGTHISGKASRQVTGGSGDLTFFLPTGFGSQQSGVNGVEVQIENGGRNRIALCLAQQTCYVCRR